MTIKNLHLSKELVLYPPTLPSLEHDLPLFLEEEEEYVVYSSPIYSLDVTIGGGQPDEDDLIEKILQNQPPNTMSLEELVKKDEDDPWNGLCLADSIPTHVKMIEFGPARTLKINLSLCTLGKGVM